MVHVMLESYDLTADYLYDELRKYVKPGMRVAVVAFSFRDTQVRDEADWDALYSADGGKYYAGIAGPFAAYGIPAENIVFVNYFKDTKNSAAEKIRNADILYFLGGLPDKTTERIEEFGLRDILLQHKGIFMGYSAGALIQLAEYHLSPDGDYPEFAYYDGLPYLRDFYLEVHYEGNEIQQKAIRRVLGEKGKRVYATADAAAAMIIAENEIRLLGDVTTFEP